MKQNGAVEEVLIECRYFSFLKQAHCKILEYHRPSSYKAKLNSVIIDLQAQTSDALGLLKQKMMMKIKK